MFRRKAFGSRPRDGLPPRGARSLLLGRNRSNLLAARLRVGDGFLFISLRLLLARGFLRALHLLALFLVQVELGLRLGDLGVVEGLFGALVLRLEVGLLALLVQLRFLVANVLLIALHVLALAVRCL